MSADNGNLSFWEHLDALREVLIRSVIVVVACGIVAFVFKEELFAIVLAPKEDSFITYRWLGFLGSIFESDPDSGFSVQLINTGLAQQFIIHVKTALCAGLMCASPYILYQIFRFVSPALYDNEKQYAVSVAGAGYIMFILGCLLSYYMIFPLTFRFLGTYQVSGDVTNMISLDSYMSTLILMCLSMGIVFEMPVLCWLFSRMGFLTPDFMRKYRKHAVVVILIAAAIITPTGDAFTLIAVSLPMWLLYEISILVSAATQRSVSRQQVLSELSQS